MKFSLGIGTASLAAASLLSPVMFAQVTAEPRARVAQSYTMVQKGGGFLGIGGMDVTAERIKALNLKEERGVEVSSVGEDSPAAKAGIKEGDVVLEFNGTPVQGTLQFQRLVGETPAGRQAKIGIWRNGAAQTLTVTLGEKKGAFAAIIPEDGAAWFSGAATPMPPMPNIEMPRFSIMTNSPMLGIEGEAMSSTEQLAEFFGVTDGILVRSVHKGSAAEKAGIKAGDVITKIDDVKVSNSGEITRTLRGLRGKKTTFTVMVIRNKKETPLSVTIEQARNSVRASLIVVNC
jgi:serine protease Do